MKIIDVIENIKKYDNMAKEKEEIKSELSKYNNELFFSFQKLIELDDYGLRDYEFLKNIKKYTRHTFDQEKVINEIKKIINSFDDVKEEIEKESLTERKKMYDYYLEEYSKNEELKNMFPNFDDLKKTLDNEYNNQSSKKIEDFTVIINDLKDIISQIDKLKNYYEKRKPYLDTEKLPKINNYDYWVLKSLFSNKKGFPIIIPNDKYKADLDRNFDSNFSIDDLMMVHATNYYPKNNLIQTDLDTKVPVLINGGYSQRNTIHTALNGRVSSHEYGNFENRKIIILDPLKRHINQVVNLMSSDTFTYGSISLSEDAVIMIKEDDFDTIYQENKEDIEKNHDKIILFRGDDKEAVNTILAILGYKPQTIGKFSWENEYNERIYNEYCMKNYPEISHSPHLSTPYYKRESEILGRNVVLDGMREKNSTYQNDTIITLKELWNLFVLFIKYNTIYYDITDKGIEYNDTNVLHEIEKYDLDDIEQYLNKNQIKSFIDKYGIVALDNEIHMIGYKEHLSLYDNISETQIEKIILLLKKQGLLKKYNELSDEGKSK